MVVARDRVASTAPPAATAALRASSVMIGVPVARVVQVATAVLRATALAAAPGSIVVPVVLRARVLVAAVRGSIVAPVVLRARAAAAIVVVAIAAASAVAIVAASAAAVATAARLRRLRPTSRWCPRPIGERGASVTVSVTVSATSATTTRRPAADAGASSALTGPACPDSHEGLVSHPRCRAFVRVERVTGSRLRRVPERSARGPTLPPVTRRGWSAAFRWS